ncbi:MAG: N-methyl-L-tryptophan oxidase, partial [Cyanobacteria bacterium PR.023]|nr:N-methyl-L-tryptophan oxidase [Cyanobacteria bacterium PR.023]
MSNSFDTIVVGLGAMGSATLYQLAQRGIRALGIDLLAPPHTLGSSHGDTRITRQAIGEGDHYTPLSLRSYEIFREMERLTETSLLEVTGGLMISSLSVPVSVVHVPQFFQNTVAAAQKFGIKHEILNAKEMRLRFPQFNVDDDEMGYFEYDAAYLRPEEIIRVQLKLAGELGATIHTNETVIGFEENAKGVEVYTNQGTYTAERLVLSVGPWLTELLPQLKPVFKVYRQVLYWFDIADSFEQFAPPKFPLFIWQLKGAEAGVYGLPALDGPNGGFKIGSSNYLTEPVTPDSVERSVSAEETVEMFNSKVERCFPLANNKCL